MTIPKYEAYLISYPDKLPPVSLLSERGIRSLPKVWQIIIYWLQLRKWF